MVGVGTAEVAVTAVAPTADTNVWPSNNRLERTRVASSLSEGGIR
jgi:hypothetical protein